MADYNINAVTRRVVFSGSAGTGPYAFTFEVLDQTDLAVYFNAVKLTLTTDYTVSVAANGTGSVTIVTGTNVPSTPVAADQITIVGARDIERTTDFVTAGDLRAAALNEQLDGQIIMVQQISEESKRAMRAPVYDPALVEDGGVVDMELPTKASRAGNYLAFDTDGNPTVGVEIGVFRGDWAASTAYALRDIVKDTTNNNIYIATTAHTSSGSLPISSNADVAKWALIVDAAAAATSATNAANSATAAATSEANAATSAANAATSEANSGTSETNSASSASAAATSAANAANSASSSSTSASNASTSEANSASSASAASTSATNAASSASAASTSATNASNSASAASTSASNAATSETNAAASAASAEAAAASVYWNFDTSTTMADPGTGDVRFNNATIASVTQVAVSASSASTGNPDVSDFVAAWDDSTSTTKGYIVIREAGAPGTTIVFAISGTITDNTTWLQIPVTHVSSAGTLSASDDLYFSFSRTGDAGISSGDLVAANNLSDVADAATARSNLSAAASGANTDITSLREVVTAAASGVVESNANFIDTCLVGPSVDGKAWAGAFSNGSVWSSLMLATVETSGANAEVNIWDLTAGVLASASPLATVTLTGATPTSIAAIMGYVIVGTSDQGMHIVDPHDGAWAERTHGWPRSLTASTAPALTNDNVQFVCAGLAQQPPFDPRTGGPMPSFGVSYGAGADGYSLIKHDGNVWDRSETVTSGAPISISGGHFLAVRESVLDIIYKSVAPIDEITYDDWDRSNISGANYNQPVQADTSLDIVERFAVGADADGLSLAYGFPFYGSLGSDDSIWANITTTYNTGYNSQGSVLTALANSKTADRSGGANTLTENGTVTEAAVETGAELNGYGPFSTANFLDRTDSDFNTGTSAFTVMLWAKETSNDTSTRMFATWGAYSGSFTGNGQWSVYVYGGSTSGNRAVGMNCTDDNYATQDALNTTVDAPESVWNHYAFVYDFPNSKMKIYLNGKKIGEGSTSNCTTVANASGSLIIGKRHDNASPFDFGSQSLFRHGVTAMNDDQVAKIYEAEKGMFVANAKCLLQGAGNAVLDARIDPLTGNYIVTQSDTQDIFNGLAIESERTIAAGGTTFEHGLLWGNGVAEINDANLYASMPATDQRQVNEMVRSMAAELPAGVDLSKAKAWVRFNGSGTIDIDASYNVESLTDNGTGDYTVNWAVPFKTSNYVVQVSANVGAAAFNGTSALTPGSVALAVETHTGARNDAAIICLSAFGDLENE